MKVNILIRLLFLILLTSNCKNSPKDGEFFEYYPGGKIWKRFIYQNGEEVYYKSYTKDGKLKGSRLKINIVPNKSKFIIYDTIVFSIKPQYSEGNSLTAFFGKLNEDGFLINRADYSRVSDSLNILHKVALDKYGEYVVSGILEESLKVGDTIFGGQSKYFPDAGSYYFRYKFVVK